MPKGPQSPALEQHEVGLSKLVVWVTGEPWRSGIRR
jgi:hypothetical protein